MGKLHHRKATGGAGTEQSVTQAQDLRTPSAGELPYRGKVTRKSMSSRPIPGAREHKFVSEGEKSMAGREETAKENASLFI